MRIGLDHYTVKDRGFTAEQVLHFAHERGLEGVQFTEPSQIDGELDPEKLLEFKAVADSMGLYVELGISSPNPSRTAPGRERPIEPRELANQLRKQLEAASILGLKAVRAYLGDRHDRFRTDIRWSEQIKLSREVLLELAPSLRELGLRIALETHADVMVGELLELIESTGPDVLGVTLDTGNLVMRLEDPLYAAERLGPWVLMTHIKDAVLAFTDRGLCWQARPVGEGVVPVAQILGVLRKSNPGINLSIELHPRTYDLPIFDRSWMAYFPRLEAADLAEVVRLARRSEALFVVGDIPRPEVLEAVPWKEREEDWLLRSAAWLRGLRTLWKSESLTVEKPIV